MVDAEATFVRSEQVSRFRWNLIPAVPIGLLGILAAGWGVYGVAYNIWLMATGGGQVALIEFIILTIFGIVWITSARAFMQSRWIFASLTSSIALIVYKLLTDP